MAGQVRVARRRDVEDDVAVRRASIEEIGKTVRILLIVGAAVAIAYFGKECVAVLAGKETDANIFVKMLGAFEMSVALSWMVGVGGLVYGQSQKRLRRSAVELLHARIKLLESEINPGRTSSRLTSRGDTNPGDK